MNDPRMYLTVAALPPLELPGPVLFEVGKARIPGRHGGRLRQLARDLADRPDVGRVALVGLRLVVPRYTGHQPEDTQQDADGHCHVAGQRLACLDAADLPRLGRPRRT